MESAESSGRESAGGASETWSATANGGHDRSRGEFVWTLQATWQLVRTRLSMDSEFSRPVCKKKKLWETLAERVTGELRAAGNPDVTVKAFECDLKWRNMLATYRKNAERAKRLGTHNVHWEFFQAMHKVLGQSKGEDKAQKKAKLDPTKLSSSLASKRFTPILPNLPLPTTPFPSRPPQDVLQLYLELQERKMNMWTQQKALEERKIEAINNLARAISSLAEDANAELPKESGCS
ncbi:hypothetical protein Z043_111327 [Scleropages formosus]|uniref:Myb/SANT-like DNA-binding domain-containing protein n=1 Tax=Scleropages formosus TaxID=113540 RepID=A0A0P7X064_SCLFO|nr:uncharacterized protein LOC108941562 [Scleropages formosus]KPP69886.1 hypothetical protein Z043_111327 [Scleropages formosus]